MSDDPWTVLELDAAAATLAEVKRCYARLLKQTRPDRDPEGFMRLRAAYEAAQAILRGGVPVTAIPVMREAGSQGDPPTGQPQPAPPVRSAPETPPEVEAALENLRAAIASRVRQKVRIAWAAFEEEALKRDLSAETRWRLFIEQFAGQSVLLLADCCTDERLLDHLKLGEMRLLRLVTDIWSKQGDAKRLDEFVVSLNRQRDLVSSETGAMALAVTAIALGAWNPEQAARFASRAFPKLPTHMRTELAERIDFETMLGRLVEPLPQLMKIPWVEALRLGDSERPWSEVITREMVIAMLRCCGTQWPGLPVLHQRLKPESWAELKALAESLLR